MMLNKGAAQAEVYFDDIKQDMCWRTRERVVTADDIMTFANVSGDFGSLHVDEDYCRRLSIYGTRVAHGVFGLAVVTGLLRTIGMTEKTLLALAGVRWSMRLPVVEGDALHVNARVTRKRTMSKPDRGIACVDASLVNQRSEVVPGWMKSSSTQCSSDHSCMTFEVSSVPLSMRKYFG
jgi:acyl dehydratase